MELDYYAVCTPSYVLSATLAPSSPAQMMFPVVQLIMGLLVHKLPAVDQCCRPGAAHPTASFGCLSHHPRTLGSLSQHDYVFIKFVCRCCHNSHW
jgi:hypothetical protein